MRKTALLWAAAFLTAFLLAGCAKRAQEPDAEPESSPETAAAQDIRVEETAPAEPGVTADELIEQIVLYHGCYGEKADEKVAGLLAELNALDPRQGALWRDIMDYWVYANTQLEVNLSTPPTDLPRDDSLCIAVLGFELNDDGTMKEELIGRLKVALECARRYPGAYVLCTGGGTAKDNADVTEAGLMGEWMRAHGIGVNRLIVEDRSLTTAENANFSYNILRADYPQVDSILLVSSSYHIAWGSLLFESAFRKSASERGMSEIHVISNCAYPTSNDIYRESEILRWQTGGMLQLIGREDLARQFYFDYDSYAKPPL